MYSAVQMVQELPDELFILILRNLPAHDLVQCRLVSRRIHEIVDSSSELQYTLELTSTGMQDQESNTYSALDKLRILRRYQDAQDTFSPQYTTECFESTAMWGSETWYCNKGLLCQLGDNEIELTQLPSTIKGVPFRQWRIVSEHPWSAVIDSEQDLIVTLHAEQDRLRVRFSSLTTGDPHKRAPTGYFYAPIPPSTTAEDWAAQFCVVKDKLAVFVSAFRDGTRVGATFSVSYWQTGALLLRWDSNELDMFSFLDEDHIIVAVKPDRTASVPARISVIPFNKVIGPTSFTTVNFILPAPSHGVSYHYVELLCYPEPGWVPQGSRGPPLFHANQTDRIIIVRSLLEDSQQEFEEGEPGYPFLLVVPSWKLLETIQHYSENHVDVYLPWSAWGMQSTRSLPYDRNAFDNLSFGTRYVTTEADRVVVYDFNRYALRREYSPESAPSNNRVSPIITMDATTLNPPAFSDIVTTSLPFRKIITPIKIADGESVGIDEDWLIVHNSTSGKPRFISI